VKTLPKTWLITEPLKQSEALAVYYPWYGAPDDNGWGRHWGVVTDDGISGSLNTPILGPYDSRNETLIFEHIRLASEHGLTGFASSWWGIDSYEDQVFEKILNISRGFKTCVYYETNRDQLPATPERIAYELNYIIEKYGGHENYLRYREKPVIFIFNADGYGRDQAFWAKTRSMILECVLVGDFRDSIIIGGLRRGSYI